MVRTRPSPLVEDVRPVKFSSMDELAAYYNNSITGKYIVRAAERMGLEPKNLGKNPEEICEGIERASLKLLRNDRGYKSPVHAVASIVMAKNDAGTAIEVLEKMISAMENEGKEQAGEFRNMADVMKEAKDIEFKINVESKSELIADEVLRISTHPNYRTSRTGIAVLVLNQRPNEGVDMVLNRLLPKLSGSEVYNLRAFVKGIMHKKKIEKGNILLNTLQTKVEEELRLMRENAA